MKIFFDTEFLEDGKTIELISIGLVKEDGSELYLINKDMDVYRIFRDDWVRKNVLRKIYDELKERYNKENDPSIFEFTADDFYYLLYLYGTEKKEIAKQIVDFVGKSPVFYAYCADYDWVVLMQLYGKMIDIPKGWRYYCRDLAQTVDELGFNTDKIKNSNEHNALDDAKWNLELYNQMKNYGPTR